MMRSNAIKKGSERAPHRALLQALGFTDWEMEQPFVGVISSYSEVMAGHTGLRQVAQAVKAGIRAAGGTPFEVNTIGVCEGLSINHAALPMVRSDPKEGKKKDRAFFDAGRARRGGETQALWRAHRAHCGRRTNG
jgi:hypothetical protein